MKIGVFSGGGSYGAYTAGILYKQKPKYDVIIGTSTGSLLAIMAATEKWEQLKHAYINVEQSSIFNISPIKSNGKIKIFNSIYRVLLGKKSLGETHNLRKLITKYFTEEDYKNIKYSNKELIVVVCNITIPNNRIEYISIKDHTYEDFCDYVWASCNVPLLTTIVEKNGCEYIDGGLCESTPVMKSLEFNPNKIDVFIHRALPNLSDKKDKIKNIFNFVFRIFDISRAEMLDDDLKILNEKCRIKNIEIKYSYLPYKFKQNALVFDKTLMNKWFNLGVIQQYFK